MSVFGVSRAPNTDICGSSKTILSRQQIDQERAEMSSEMTMYRGILIEQSVDDTETVLRYARVVGERAALLESEDFRGSMRFIEVQVDESSLWTVLRTVAESIKSPGWFFHLVGAGRLYVVLPAAVLFANEGDEARLNAIVSFAAGLGIHPEQLNLAKLFADPYA